MVGGRESQRKAGLQSERRCYEPCTLHAFEVCPCTVCKSVSCLQSRAVANLKMDGGAAWITENFRRKEKLHKNVKKGTHTHTQTILSQFISFSFCLTYPITLKFSTSITIVNLNLYLIFIWFPSVSVSRVNFFAFSPGSRQRLSLESSPGCVLYYVPHIASTRCIFLRTALLTEQTPFRDHNPDLPTPQGISLSGIGAWLLEREKV